MFKNNKALKICVILALYLQLIEQYNAKSISRKIDGIDSEVIQQRNKNYTISNNKNTSIRRKSLGLRMEGFIVGGDTAKIEDFPHSVHVSFSHGGFAHLCGASVINQRLTLTAGHCLEHCEKKCEIYLEFGSAYTSEEEKPLFVTKVNNYVIHCDYHRTKLLADIGIMYMTTDLILGDKIKRVILKETFPNENPLTAFTAGWGVISEDQKQSFVLKYVRQRVHNPDECQKKFKTRKHVGVFCAIANTKSYPYLGDSGSALITKNFQQIGLVSFRERAKKHVAIYTNVSYYIQWIHDKGFEIFCQEEKDCSEEI